MLFLTSVNLEGGVRKKGVGGNLTIPGYTLIHDPQWDGGGGPGQKHHAPNEWLGEWSLECAPKGSMDPRNLLFGGNWELSLGKNWEAGDRTGGWNQASWGVPEKKRGP